MDHSWFCDNVFEIVVLKKTLEKGVLSILDQEPQILDPWDSYGSVMCKSCTFCKQRE